MVYMRPSTIHAHSISGVQRFCALPSFKVLSAPDLSRELRCDSVEQELKQLYFAKPNAIIAHLELWNCAASAGCLYCLAHPDDPAPPFMGSLRRFSALAELRTTYGCLMGKDDYRPDLGLILPSSIRSLALDGRSHSHIDIHVFEPVENTVDFAIRAKQGQGIRPIARLEELIFTGYKGFRNETVKS